MYKILVIETGDYLYSLYGNAAMSWWTFEEIDSRLKDSNSPYKQIVFKTKQSASAALLNTFWTVSINSIPCNIKDNLTAFEIVEVD